MAKKETKEPVYDLTADFDIIREIIEEKNDRFNDLLNLLKKSFQI